MTITVSANNGTAPAGELATLPGMNGDGSWHTAPHVTAAAYARLRSAMLAAGLGDLLPSDGWSCYRDRAAQQHMRDLGLTTIPVGQSIHGEWTYGSAVDFQDLGGFGAPRHEWLRDNGAGFGWYQPSWATAGGSLPEPWHWEYDQRTDPGILPPLPPEESDGGVPTMQHLLQIDPQIDGRWFLVSYGAGIAQRMWNGTQMELVKRDPEIDVVTGPQPPTILDGLTIRGE